MEIQKIKYTCNLCLRSNFDKKTPHNCKSGYQKRKLKWSINKNI